MGGDALQAIILAGGKGRRLLPYTMVLPKPLMPIKDMPVLEVVIRQLTHRGFSDICIATGHLGELIEAFFRDGSRFGARIRYSIEETPLGTAGPVKLAGPTADDFLVMNGDILTTLDYRRLFDFHLRHGVVIETTYGSVLSLLVFLAHHEVGSHYNYSRVPYASWWSALAGDRNHYDRLVHFSFGLLIAPAVWELLSRVAP